MVDCSVLPEWDAGTAYETEGTQVMYNDNVYSNYWYSIGQNPEENSSEYDVWTLVGRCDPSITLTPSPSPTPSYDPNITPVPGSDAVDLSQQMGVGIPFHFKTTIVPESQEPYLKTTEPVLYRA